MDKINVNDKTMILKPEKKKIWKSKKFFINLYVIDGLEMEFSLLSRADARRSTDIIYRM